MSVSVSPVTSPVRLGEGPHWDHEAQCLYFVSIYDQTINKYVPSTGIHTNSKLDDVACYILPIENKPNHFIVGVGRRVEEVKWDGSNGTAIVVRTITEVDTDNPNTRFNDAKADPRGRLFAGTMGLEYAPGQFYPKRGSLFRIDGTGCHKLDEGMEIPNGMCWDVKNKAFYFADSGEYTIRRYDYDIDTGNISNPRVVFRCADHGVKGIVDGMTIDAEGNIWFANWDGHQVVKVDPRTGSVLQRVAIPALQTSSATFGGPALDELYVTSAAVDRGEEQKPPCGSTFRVTGLGVKGHKNDKVRID